MIKRYISDVGDGNTAFIIRLYEDGKYHFECDDYVGERVFVRLSKDQFKSIFADMKKEMEVIETEEIDTRIVSMTGYELAARFIGELEHAGFNPYMFNEGQADHSDDFELNHQQCIAMGMSETEFNGRAKNV